MSGVHHGLDTTHPVRYIASRRVTLVSVVLNIVLTAAQMVVGIIGQSQALVADAVHTLSDLITDVMVLFALKHSAKAADEEHPYGHGRIETATTLLLGALLLAVGVGIAFGAGARFLDAEPFVVPAAITLWVAVITLLAKEGLYRYTLRTATRFDSDMLRANAWHHRSDAISSLIVVVGIGGSLVGWPYLDAVAAILVAAMVVKIGFGLAWRALRELIDTGLGAEDLAAIRSTINTVSGVRALHMLRTRQVAGQAFVDVHILVDPRVSVSEGHRISEAVRLKLIAEVGPVTDVMVHVDSEEDQTPAPEPATPSRDELTKRLAQYFRDIPEARLIERTTLHYIKGRVDVELLLPLVTVDKAPELARRFAAATKNDPDIRSIDVWYH